MEHDEAVRHRLENSIRADLHREINLATFRLLGGMVALAGITWAP